MEWIVINKERTNLPDLCSDILVTYDYGDSVSTEAAYFDEVGNFYDNSCKSIWNDKVIAWMPLPEPYKPPKH